MHNYVCDLFFHYYSNTLAVALHIPNSGFEIMTALYAATSFSFSRRLSASERITLSSAIKDKLFTDRITSSKEQAVFNERVTKYYSIDYGFKPAGKWVFSDTFSMIYDPITSCVILLGDFLCDKCNHNIDSKFFHTFEKQTMSYIYDLFRAYSLQISVLPTSELIGSKYYSEAMYPIDDDHYYNAQFSRADRSKSIPPNSFSIDAESQFGSFVGSERDSYAVTRDSCSCLDFKKRRLPCKHMYRLHDELAAADPTGLYIPHYPLQPIMLFEHNNIRPIHAEKQIETIKQPSPAKQPNETALIKTISINPTLDQTNPIPTRKDTFTAKVFCNIKSFFSRIFNSGTFLFALMFLIPILLIIYHVHDVNENKVRSHQISPTNNFTYWNIPEQQDTTDFVLNTESMIVHFSWCGTVPHINPDNYKTCKNLQSALNQGYRRCKLCDPYEISITEAKPSTTKRQSPATTKERSFNETKSNHTITTSITAPPYSTTAVTEQQTTVSFWSLEDFSAFVLDNSGVTTATEAEDATTSAYDGTTTTLAVLSETSDYAETVLSLIPVFMLFLLCGLLALMYHLAHPKSQ